MGLIDFITTRIALRSIRKEIKKKRKNYIKYKQPVKVVLRGKLPNERIYFKGSRVNVTTISVFPSKEIEEKALKAIPCNSQIP